MDDIFKKLEELGHTRKTRTEVEKKLFGGQTRREMMGLSKDDPITPEQMRKIFAVGGELGLKKDDIKREYNIDSLKDLTVIEAIDLINQMETDAGVTYVPEKKETVAPASVFGSDAYASSEWTKVAGVNMIDGKVAKCGLCKSYVDRGCKLGNVKGKFEETKLAPIVKDCFTFKYGELKKVEINREEQDDDPF